MPLFYILEVAMSWTEDLGDIGRDQGDRGTIEFTPGKRPPPTLKGSIVRIILAILLVRFYVWAIAEAFDPITYKDWAFYGWMLFVYGFFAYFVRPKPGSYLGGVFYHQGKCTTDDPYTKTDDINNLLLNIKIFFLPGVILSESIIEPFRLLLRVMFPVWYKDKKKNK